MTLEIFLLLLMAASILTSLFTEGIKTALSEWKGSCYPNTIAGIVSVVLSTAICIAYTIMADVQFNAKMAVMLIALVLLSWLSSMIGYDKVKQAILQIIASKGK